MPYQVVVTPVIDVPEKSTREFTEFDLYYDRVLPPNHTIIYPYQDSAKWHDWFSSKNGIHVKDVRIK